MNCMTRSGRICSRCGRRRRCWRRACKRTVDANAVEAAISIRDQVEALQGHNRRILARLRPAALEELGLIAALRALIEQWRKDEPDVALALSARERVADLGERASLMAYRFVQEALTNAFRHSHARHIDVTLAYEAAGQREAFAIRRWQGFASAFATTAEASAPTRRRVWGFWACANGCGR